MWGAEGSNGCKPFDFCRVPSRLGRAEWLNVSEMYDCYLLDENLATMRTKWGRLGGILLTDKLKWRYDAYRYDEWLGRITSLVYTIRNGWYGIVKWRKYVKRGSERYPN